MVSVSAHLGTTKTLKTMNAYLLNLIVILWKEFMIHWMVQVGVTIVMIPAKSAKMEQVNASIVVMNLMK